MVNVPPPRPPVVNPAEQAAQAAETQRDADSVTDTGPTTTFAASTREEGSTTAGAGVVTEVLQETELLFGVRSSDGATPEVLLALRVGGTDSSLRAALGSLRDSIERQGIAVGEVRVSAFERPAAVHRVAPPAIPVPVAFEEEDVSDASAEVPGHGDEFGSAAEQYAAEAFRRDIARREFTQKVMDEQREKALRPSSSVEALRATVAIDKVARTSNISHASCWFDLVGFARFDCDLGEAGISSIAEPFSAFAANATESLGLTRLRLVEGTGIVKDIDYPEDLSYNTAESGERPESPITASTAVLAGEQAPTSDEIISSVVEQIRSVTDPMGRLVLADALERAIKDPIIQEAIDAAAEVRAADGTWKQIGDELNMSPQAAQSRFSESGRQRNADRAKRRYEEGTK